MAFYEKGLQPVGRRRDRAEPAPSTWSTPPRRARCGSGDGGDRDPHFWLDPTLLARAAAAFTARDGARPTRTHAADYRRRTPAWTDLARWTARSHRAGPLPDPHDRGQPRRVRVLRPALRLDCTPIAGLSPDAEPSAKRSRELADLAAGKG